MRIRIEDLTFIGRGLNRPECVVAAADGTVHAANWAGGVSLIAPDGGVRDILARDAGFELRPNGVCLLPEGGWLLAHLGAETGGVFHLDEAGRLTPFLTELDGRPLPPTNFAHPDAKGRTWISVSTRHVPRHRACRADIADGFIVMVDRAGRARLAADELGYTNECVVHPDGSALFVNETFARRTSAFAIAEDGGLGPRRTVAEYGAGTFPDGLAFDEDGAVWITSIVSNRVLRVTPDGRQETVLEDADADHVAWVEAAYRAGSLGREHLDRIASRRLKNISSLAFGGPDLRTIHLGCLLGESIACARVDVAGAPPPHWPRPAGLEGAQE